MTRNLFILFTSLFWHLNSFAQTKDSVCRSKIQFCSKNELGGLIGIGHIKNPNDYLVRNPEWAVELTSTNGIRYNPWFVGIGLGVRAWGTDLTFPVFVNVSLDLWKSAFFLHADMGHQFGIRKSNYFGDRETGSFYAAYGLGYNFAIKKQNLYVKASLCHQRMKAATKAGLGPGNYLESYDPTYLFFRISLGIKFTK
nr:hypothetical protein [uncultured Fluviicola sp.]